MGRSTPMHVWAVLNELSELFFNDIKVGGVLGGKIWGEREKSRHTVYRYETVKECIKYIKI